MPGQGSSLHASASQRKIAILEKSRDHLLQVIAVLVAQQGGKAVIPQASLAHQFKFSYAYDPDTGALHYASVPHGFEEAIASALAEPPAEKEPG